MSATQYGPLLKRLRLAKNISGVDFANVIGVTSNHLSRVERGVKGLALPRLRKAARFFGLTIDQLLGGHGGRRRRAS